MSPGSPIDEECQLTTGPYCHAVMQHHIPSIFLSIDHIGCSAYHEKQKKIEQSGFMTVVFNKYFISLDIE